MDRKKRLFDLIELFQAIVAKYARFDEMAIAFTDGAGSLFKGELHFIQCVKKHEEEKLTRLADLLGVTRGAVSQTLVKLEKKKLVERVKRNRKEFTLKLTPAGEDIYRKHEEFHRKHFRELEQAMTLLPPRQIDFIEWLFRKINSFYDQFAKRVTADAAALRAGKRPRKGD